VGTALRKKPGSRKVDKCGTVFGERGEDQAILVSDNRRCWVRSNVKRPVLASLKSAAASREVLVAISLGEEEGDHLLACPV